jgi:hypothetical protein
MYGTKGGTLGGPTKTDGIPSNSGKPGSATTSATPKVTSSPKPGSTTDQEELPLQKKSALDSLKEYFMDQLESRGISLPIFLIALGLGLLLLVIIISLILRMMGDSNNQPPMIVPVGRDRDKEKDTKYENQLASKINTLQQAKQPTSPVTAMPAVAALVPQAQPMPMATVPTPTAPSPAPMPASPTAPASSGMMARLQDKGIKPPVITAMAKYNASELVRKVVIDGMDIMGGAGISRGKRNLLASQYVSTPIGITVEGANILTRTLIIFGQGALRAHPYAYAEVRAVEENSSSI